MKSVKSGVTRKTEAHAIFSKSCFQSMRSSLTSMTMKTIIAKKTLHAKRSKRKSETSCSKRKQRSLLVTIIQTPKRRNLKNLRQPLKAPQVFLKTKKMRLL